MQEQQEQNSQTGLVGQAPETEIEALLIALHRENNRFGKPFWDRVLVVSMALYALSFVLGAIMKSALLGEILLYVGILGGIALIMGIQLNFFETETPRHRTLLHTLSQWNDVRAVGPLMQMLYPTTFHVGQKGALQGKTRQSVISVLLRLVPRLHPEDATQWTSEQRQSIHRCLFTGENVLAISLLKALGQIGSIDDLPAVQRLAFRKGLAKHSAAVRVEAERCLQLLQQRIGPELERQILVRPTKSRQDPSETLLRPAQAAPDSNPTLLLRQVNGEEHRPPGE